MNEEKSTSLAAKISDYTTLAVGTNVLVDGIVRVAYNHSEHFAAINSQLVWGRAEIMLGAVAIVYGIGRVINYSKE